MLGSLWSYVLHYLLFLLPPFYLVLLLATSSRFLQNPAKLPNIFSMDLSWMPDPCWVCTGIILPPASVGSVNHFHKSPLLITSNECLLGFNLVSAPWNHSSISASLQVVKPHKIAAKIDRQFFYIRRCFRCSCLIGILWIVMIPPNVLMS